MSWMIDTGWCGQRRPTSLALWIEITGVFCTISCFCVGRCVAKSRWKKLIVPLGQTEHGHDPCHDCWLADARSLAWSRGHFSAVPARLRITTAVPPPDAGVGFLYVISSPLIVMNRF